VEKNLNILVLDLEQVIRRKKALYEYLSNYLSDGVIFVDSIY